MALELLFNAKDLASSKVNNLNKNLNVLDKTTAKISKSFMGLQREVLALGGSYLALSGISKATSSFIAQADAMTNVNSKLQLVTKTTQELTQAQASLFKISQETRVGFTDTVDLYSRMARSTESLNLSQSELLGITQTINKALIISGGSTESMNAALIQLGQGFASGTLRGEELNSVMEQTPRLAKAIADGMGIAVGELRTFAKDGLITSEVVTDALKSQANAVSSEFGKMAKTYAQSVTQISNSSTKVIGELDKVYGITETLSDSFTDLSKSIESIDSDSIDSVLNLGKAVATVGVGYVAVTKSIKLYKAVQDASIVTTTKYNTATNQTRVITTKLSKSQMIATASTKALSTAMKTIPHVALAAGIIAIADSLFTASTNSDKLQKTMNSTSEALKTLTNNQLDYRIALVDTEIMEQKLARGYAKTDAMKQNFWESDTQHKEDIALIDEITGKLKELQKVRVQLSDAKVVDLGTINKNGKKDDSSGKITNKKSEGFETSLQGWQDYYKTIGDLNTAWLIEESQLKLQWIDLTDEQFKKASDIAKAEFFEKIDTDLPDIKLNVQLEGWDETSNNIAQLGNSFQDLQDANEQYAEDKVTYAKDSKKMAKLESNYAKDQMSAYAGMAGAAASMFGENTAAAKAFHAVEVGLNSAKMAMMIAEMTMNATATTASVANSATVATGKMAEAGANATASVTAAGGGDPYTAPARVAVMVGLMTAAMSMFGGSGGGGSVSAPSYQGTIDSASFGSSVSDRQGVSLGDYNGNFDKFIEGLDSASERLESFGSVGSSLSGRVSTLISGQSSAKARLSAAYVDLEEEQLREIDKNWIRNHTIPLMNQYISSLTSELNTVLTEAVSEALDFDLLNKSQLESVIGDFDASAYQDVLEDINDLAIKAKAQGGVLTEEDKKLLIDLYTIPNFIKGQDYEEALDAYRDLNETIFGIMQSANSYQLSFGSGDRSSQIVEEIEQLKSTLPKLNGVVASNFVDLYRQIDPTDSDLIDSYDTLGDLLLEQIDLNNELTDSYDDMASSIDNAILSIKGNTESAETITKEQLIQLNENQRAFQVALGANNADDAKETLGQITSLSTALGSSFLGQSSNLSSSLIANLEQNKSLINFEDEILNVNIVSSEISTVDSGITTPTTTTPSSTTSSNDERLANIEALLIELLINSGKNLKIQQDFQENGVISL